MPAPDPTSASATFTFTDNSENTARMTIPVPFGTPLADCDDLYDALKAASDIALEKLSVETTGADPSVTGSDGAYDDAEDKAVLMFEDDYGKTHVFQLPGPKATCFQADEETVDEFDSLIADVITKLSALFASAGAAILVEYIRGYRKRAKSQRNPPGVSIGHTS